MLAQLGVEGLQLGEDDLVGLLLGLVQLVVGPALVGYHQAAAAGGEQEQEQYLAWTCWSRDHRYGLVPSMHNGAGGAAILVLR